MPNPIQQVQTGLVRLAGMSGQPIADAALEMWGDMDLATLDQARVEVVQEFLKCIEVQAREEIQAVDEGNEPWDLPEIFSDVLRDNLAYVAQKPRGHRVAMQLKEAVAEEIRLVRAAAAPANSEDSTLIAVGWANSPNVANPQNLVEARRYLVALSLLRLILDRGARFAGQQSGLSRVQEHLESCIPLLSLLNPHWDPANPDSADHLEGEVDDLPYENQILGGFIYALGYQCSTAQVVMPINLFQQTPLDGTFGDLLAGAEKCFALEFKRDFDDVESEAGKWIPTALSTFLENEPLVDLSLRGHVLCYGKHLGSQMGVESMGYATALGATKPGIQLGSQKLIELLINSATPGQAQGDKGLAPKEMEDYLRALSYARTRRTGGKQAVWLAVAVSDQGVLMHLASSLDQLWRAFGGPGRQPALQHNPLACIADPSGVVKMDPTRKKSRP
ncbi:hypothetical protein FJP65_12710 [Stenotrophomonas maltophilia]|nr:hypothetical protein FJP65_12710 [Stenotrophomonas maltophilia]